MKEIKLAIPTEGSDGLEDTVSEVFARAKTFTIVEIRNDSIRGVKIVENPAAAYKHGAGPIVVKMLVDEGVTLVAVKALGIGASTLLKHHSVQTVTVKPGVKVAKAVQSVPR